MLSIFVWIIAFIIGTLLGSFCTLAVYRIPLKQDITHVRSFCVNCKHKLNFFDLIPVLSYLFLGGKCRYCGQKIRPRYLMLEILFGITYMLYIMSLNINLELINIHHLIYVLFASLYLVTLFLIAGIDKEYRKIQSSVLIFGLVSMLCYIVYLYVLNINIYRYVIYLCISFAFLIAGYIFLKKFHKCSYFLEIISLMAFILFFTNVKMLLLASILTVITITIYNIANKKEEKNDIPIGFILCVFSILLLVYNNFTMLGVCK